MSNNNTKTTKLQYPKYNDGTVLTSQDLNDSFDFLHEQLKATRSLLSGQGILYGLNCKFDKKAGVITITPGKALTAKGSLIELFEERELRYFVDKEPFSRREKHSLQRDWWDKVLADVDYVLESNKEVDGIALADLKDNDNYLLGLQVLYKEVGEEYPTEQKNSIRGNKDVEIEFVPFLKRSADILGDQQESSFHAISELNAPTVSGWADYKVLPVFLRKVADGFDERMKAIKCKLEEINEIEFEQLLSESQWQWFVLLLGRETPLQGSIDQIDTIHFNNKQIHTYLSFVEDLHKAVNEFITFYNDFQSKYKLVLGNRLADAVILGRMNAADVNADDALRYTLMETYRDYDRSKEERIMVRLLRRITLVIKSFSPSEMFESDKKDGFIPSSVNAKLGERDVPYYYQKAELNDYWDAHNDKHVKKQPSSDESKEAFAKADLYRLSFNNINVFKMNDLRIQAKANNLPIIILKYELEGDDVSYCLENYNDAQVERTLIDCKKIANLIFEQELIDEKDQKECVQRVINEIWDCYEGFDVKEASKKMAEGLRETLIEEIRQSIYVLTKKEEKEQKQELASAERNALEFLMMAILYHRCGEDVFNPVNMPGVDFVGGVEKRDVMLLVTHRDKVLTCLNVPYLSLVLHMDEKMFKEQLAEYNKEEKKSDLSSIFLHSKGE